MDRRTIPFTVIFLMGLLILAGCSQPTARAETGGYAYVPNARDGTVSAIDLRTDQVAWTLPVGERASHSIAASPDGHIVYAGDAEAREVVVIDARNQTIVKRIPLGHDLHGIDIAPDGRTLWVGGSLNNDPVLGTLSVIDTASNTVQTVISPGLGSASHFSFTPDGKEVWIASTSTNLVWIVDTETRRVTAAVPLALPMAERRPDPDDDWTAYLAERKIIGLNEVAIAPDGQQAYAVGPTTSQLYAIDVAKRQVEKSIRVGERAHGVTVSPDGREVWVADWNGTVHVLDAQSLEPLATIPVAEATGLERGANHVAFRHDGQQVYVSSNGSVAVLDAAQRRVLRRVPVGQEPHEISLEDWVAPDASIDSEAILAALPPVTTPAQAGTASPVAQARPEGTGDSLIRIDDQRSVVVEVTPLNLDGSGETLDFQVLLNTHTVELNYDLTQIAVLRDDRGNEYRPVAWQGPTGGHHVSGLLQFAPAGDILQLRPEGAPTTLELELQGIAGVPSRVFRWTLAP